MLRATVRFATCFPARRSALQRLAVSRRQSFVRSISEAVQEPPCPVVDSRGVKNHCWACGQNLSHCDFFCCSCGKLQPRGESPACSYFLLLAMPEKFKIDVAELEKHYKGLQSRVHPDIHGLKSEAEREYSAKNSACINKAYEVLRHPNLRINYLLKRQGIDAVSEGGRTNVCPMLLMHVMEQRERIQDANKAQELQQVKEENQKEIDECLQAIEKAYDRDRDLAAAEALAVRLQYLTKIASEIRDKELDV